MDRDHRLATYGTLAPGRPNHHHLAMLAGRWHMGTVGGTLVPVGWGAGMGYPALRPSADGGRVAVHLLESPDLPLHWARLDAFEGHDYVRIPIDVLVDGGSLPAWIYAARLP